MPKQFWCVYKKTSWTDAIDIINNLEAYIFPARRPSTQIQKKNKTLWGFSRVEHELVANKDN